MIIGQRVWIPVDPQTGVPSAQARYATRAECEAKHSGAEATSYYVRLPIEKTGLLWELA